jgi:medium-chain acyl-[acyl-carrier-protein] hydrolase
MAYTTEPFLMSYVPERSHARLRLFCFPFAGAGASIFHEWPLDLPAAAQVLGVQLPGRENRMGEQPFRHVFPAVREIAKVVRRCGNLPFAFFGHSTGALLAFELTRELGRLRSAGPIHLFVSGYRAPSRPNLDAPIHELPDSLLIQELRRLGGTPRAILENQEVMRLLLPVVRADFEMSETYRYEQHAPLQCPITVFGGLQDGSVRNSDLPGWKNETRGSFSIRMFPGDHYFIRSCRIPVLRSITEQLGPMLAATAASGRS